MFLNAVSGCDRPIKMSFGTNPFRPQRSTQTIAVYRIVKTIYAHRATKYEAHT